ncbi:glycosyl hydrolase family 61-domain-containing protein [Mycena olivaceomarginata]|nr:glycosyl hydrolase family 61-domain-containing protein [Mycena olivaceomarginata]
MKCSASVLFSVSLVTSVVGHGWVGTLHVGGKAYKGNQPLEQAPNGAPSVVRQIANNLPVKDVSLPDLTCGRSAKPAMLAAATQPGDIVLINWHTLTGDGNWFHDVGPMMTYLAKCDANCAGYDASKARWFKIAEQGQDGNGNWAQAKLDDGSPARVKIPGNLEAGEYLMRHEIIALHTAQSSGGAEFYISCSQLKVVGSGSGAPKESELVRFPGAYHAKDKGILIDIYNMKETYQFPGPPVAAFVNGGPSPAHSPHSSSFSHSNATHPPAHTTTHAAPHPTTTPAAAATKTCKGKRRRSPNGAADAPASVRRAHKRHMHRVGARSL